MAVSTPSSESDKTLQNASCWNQKKKSGNMIKYQSKELHILQEKRSFSSSITSCQTTKILYPQEPYNTQCRKAGRQNGLRGDFSKEKIRSRDNGEAAG